MHRLLGSLATSALCLTLVACGDDDADGAASATSAASDTTATTQPTIREGEPWIAFQGVSLGITMIRPDGSGSHAILDDLPGDQLHPDWSPDGGQLAFTQADDRTSEVWLSDSAGRNPEPLLAEYPAELSDLLWDNPAWSPNGAQIAMVGYEGGSNVGLPIRAVLAVVDVATDELMVAGDYPFDGPYPGVSFPRWSPDGNAMVLAIGRFDENDENVGEAIAVMKRTGGTWSVPTVITPFDDFATRPDWHPTDDLIIFVTHDVGAFQSTEDPSNLFTIRSDGTGLTQVTQFGPGEDRASQPSWTSDGRIVFTLLTGAGDHQRNIAFVDADGTDLEIVTDDSDVGIDNRPHPRLRPVR